MACATRLEMMAMWSPWHHLQCKLGASGAQKPVADGGRVLYVVLLCPPPQVIRFGTPWLGSPHLSRHDPDSSKMTTLCISPAICTNALFVLPDATIVLGGCSNH